MRVSELLDYIVISDDCDHSNPASKRSRRAQTKAAVEQRAMRKPIVMLGPFPPPVTGAANITDGVYRALVRTRSPVRKISVSVQSYRNGGDVTYHLRRMIKAVVSLAKLVAFGGKGAIAYIVPDGGLGLYYTLFYVLAARLFYDKVVLHHHSYKYINHHAFPMEAIVRVSRECALHVFLSEGMGGDFCRRYGAVAQNVATNACFVVPDEGAWRASKSDTLRLGHLSNLSRSKGFDLFADLFETLRARDYDVEIHLAGPILDGSVRQRIDQLRAQYVDRVHYAGPVYDTEKLEFYRNIDVFVFPTLYLDEAQPLVVYEALSAGVSVLATPRGTIPEMLNGVFGKTSPSESTFLEFAVGQIGAMSTDGASRRRALILEKMHQECQKSRSQYKELFRRLGVSDDSAA